MPVPKGAGLSWCLSFPSKYTAKLWGPRELLPVGLTWCSQRFLDFSFSWFLAPVYYVDLGFHHLQRGLILFGWGIAKPLFCAIRHV